MRLGDGLWTPGVLPPHFVNYLPNSPAQGEAAHCHLLGWRACPRGLPAVILPSAGLAGLPPGPPRSYTAPTVFLAHTHSACGLTPTSHP